MTTLNLKRLKEIRGWFGEGFYLASLGCDIETGKELKDIEMMPFCHLPKKKNSVFLVKAKLK
jgi:hypothetical protein